VSPPNGGKQKLETGKWKMEICSSQLDRRVSLKRAFIFNNIPGLFLQKDSWPAQAETLGLVPGSAWRRVR